MIFKHQQLAQIIATLLISAFFVFIAGYYWGKKSALETFAHQFEQDSFADKIAYSLCSIYDQTDNESDVDTADSQDVANENQDEQDSPEGQAYFAQLAGFGSSATTKKYVDLLKQKGFKVNIVEKKSKTSKGKTITWYQVVTDYFSTEKDLLNVIDKINKISKLTDVKVVTLKPETTASERQN